MKRKLSLSFFIFFVGGSRKLRILDHKNVEKKGCYAHDTMKVLVSNTLSNKHACNSKVGYLNSK